MWKPEDDERQLIEKLRKIEALFARPGTDGERHAAESAAARIRDRLRALERTERPIEYRFSLPDTWSRTLFIALLRRYGLKHYRYHGQRRTTVMVKVTKSFVDQTLWPEFQQLVTVLEEHLEEVTRRVIDNALGSHDTSTETGQGAAY